MPLLLGGIQFYVSFSEKDSAIFSSNHVIAGNDMHVLVRGENVDGIKCDFNLVNDMTISCYVFETPMNWSQHFTFVAWKREQHKMHRTSANGFLCKIKEMTTDICETCVQNAAK